MEKDERKVSEALGKIRKNLISQGFSEDQAFSLTTDILRRVQFLDDLLDME